MSSTLNFLTISFFIGIAVVLFCMLAYIFPYGERFRDKTQKIKGFGLDLEVSVLTVFILIGFVFTFSGILLQIRGYDDQLKKLEEARLERDARIAHMQLDIERLQKMEIHALVTLEGVDPGAFSRLSDLECEYTLSGRGEPQKADISKGDGNSIQVTLKDVTRETHIRRLVLEDRGSNSKWEYVNFDPLQPIYNLKKTGVGFHE